MTISVKGIASTIGDSGLVFFDGTQALRDFMDLLRVREEEHTKREEIWVRRDLLVERLSMQERVISSYFDLRFAERSEALHQFYELLGRGVDTKDKDVIDRALSGILGIVQDNPLKDFESFAAFWNSEDRPDLEF